MTAKTKREAKRTNLGVTEKPVYWVYPLTYTDDDGVERYCSTTAATRAFIILPPPEGSRSRTWRWSGITHAGETVRGHMTCDHIDNVTRHIDTLIDEDFSQFPHFKD